jgi:hypothetical protein
MMQTGCKDMIYCHPLQRRYNQDTGSSAGRISVKTVIAVSFATLTV